MNDHFEFGGCRMLVGFALCLCAVRHVCAEQAATATASSQDPASTARDVPDDRYSPIPGGWQIRLHGADFYKDIAKKNATVMRDELPVAAIDARTGRLTADAPIGLLLDNPREHCRPLFPPAEKSLVWTEEEQARTQRVSFRPVVVAGVVPQFLLEYHSAGGMLGRLHFGLIRPGEAGVWLHEWPDLVVRCLHGRMEYRLLDGTAAGTALRLTASPLANAAGVIVKVDIKNAPPGTTLIWAYGGVSASYTNGNPILPQFGFSPSHCAGNAYSIESQSFLLQRAFGKSDGIVTGEGASVGIMSALPDWKARIRGGSSWKTGIGFAPPEAFTAAPAEMLKQAAFEQKSRSDCVIVEKVPIGGDQTAGFVVVGMGGDIDAAVAKPAEAWKAAIDRNHSIARRIVTRTPDPHLDAAMTTLAFSNEGHWGSQAYLHGGWSWRNAYLGWRTLYGPTMYGWTDRVRKNILNRCRLSAIKEGEDAGGIACMLEGMGFYYNMDEVFFDMVRHYFDYTNDVELMKEAFPVLEGAIERENRRLRPAGGVLYESALNTWISDSHWYIDSQCTQASAYMLRTYEFMADVARRIGRDDKPFREQAGRIREAIQSVLWQKRLGVFAECLDTRGHRLLHPEPELPTIYHSAEFGAADPLQISQMLHWADKHLRQERTAGDGRLYWSSNWFPNHGLSYTHSTYEMAYAEELNFAETNFLAGRADVGYAIIRACLSGIFNGPMPGGLSCHAFVDGTQRANWEFADGVSLWGRTVVEGLFGIRVKRPEGVVELAPQIPPQWPEASIETPHFSYRFRRSAGRTLIQWSSPVEAAVRLRLPLVIGAAPRVSIDNREASCRLSKGVGFTWVEVDITKATQGEIRVDYSPADSTRPIQVTAKQGESVRVTMPGKPIAEYSDPQGLVAAARVKSGVLTGKVEAQPGPGLLFVSSGNREAPCWLPVDVEIEPAKPVERPKWSFPDAGSKDLGRWTLIDMGKVFNASVPEVPKRVADGAIPPPLPASQIGFGYWIEHVITRCKPPCDTAWRAKVGEDGLAWTVDGVPFRTNKEGSNIAAACLHNKAFPPRVSFAVRASGQALYLMISGETWPAQSHVVNVRISLRYADGTTEQHDLVQPFDIGNCWGEWCGLYFDTPVNGFENIGGRRGPAGSSEVSDVTKPAAVDSIAHLVRFDLPRGKRLDEVTMEVMANDVVFGIMGASVLKGTD